MSNEDMYRGMLQAAWDSVKLPKEPASPPASFTVGFFQGLRYLIGYVEDTTSPPIDTGKLMVSAINARMAYRRCANDKSKKR